MIFKTFAYIQGQTEPTADFLQFEKAQTLWHRAVRDFCSFCIMFFCFGIQKPEIYKYWQKMQQKPIPFFFKSFIKRFLELYSTLATANYF
jgi:hypothetical protein